MPSNNLPDADLNLPEMKTKSPSCPAGGVHMYAEAISHTVFEPRRQEIISKRTEKRVIYDSKK